MKKLLLLSLAVFLFGQLAISQNHSLNFDGTDDEVSTTSPGITGSAQRTVEAWVKTTWNGTQRIIVNWGVFATGTRYTFGMNGGNIRVEVGGNGVSGPSISDGNWHHVAATYDNSLATEKHKLFIDGVQVASSNLTVATNTSAGNILIGKRVDGVNFWQGNMDDVRVWDVARTEAEISANMNTELSGTEANLVFYAKMDDDAASCDVVDCSSGQNHGTRLGASGGNNLPQFSTDIPAGVTDVPCGVCISNCTLGTCDISSVLVSNISACDDNGTTDTADDFFTADVTVDFMGNPTSGTLDLSGDGTASIAVSSLTNCTHTFTGVTMSADGTAIDLTASFSANGTCSMNNSSAGTAPSACSMAPPPPAACAITAITASNISTCDDGGTDDNTSDDTFTADVTVTFTDPPASGTLDLTGDGSASVAVGSLGAGTHTFNGVTMPANGGNIVLTATFSAEPACTLTNNNAGNAPSSCSPNAPAIPTMSEWGLILFALIIFTLSVVYGTQQQRALAMNGSAESVSANWKLPFDKTKFFKALPFVYLGFAVVFSLAVLLLGYEMTNADVPGSLLSGLVIAYLVQFVLKNSKR